MTKIVRKSLQFGQNQLTLETGAIARQADGAVLVTYGETVVLVTAVGQKEAQPGRDFFPLTVDYREKTYAAGRVPGGYFKREARPNETEVLTSRLIDRPIRPLFPKGFRNDVQIIATVLSLDPEVNPDIPALIGASAALSISGMPFLGPIAAARVGYRDGQYLLNPNHSELENSQLDLVVAGTQAAVLMVESEAKVLSEEIMLGAVMFGHEQMQVVVDTIAQFAAEAGKPSWDWQPPAENAEQLQQAETLIGAKVKEAYCIADKMQRKQQLDVLREELTNHFRSEGSEEDVQAEVAKKLFAKIEKNLVRSNVLAGESRIDGRDLKTVRPIAVDVGILPRTHGSALFTRGETQAMVVSTLGSDRDAQTIDEIMGERKDRFLLHYNFPPYSVGETGFIGSPKRREIGHGNLAKRAIKAVLPDQTEFPYVIRVVSEIMESNGSSSMASVCGTSLSLMDAGVPIKSPVAGIAMGLIKEADQFAVLTDILGDEDHLGDMDFKVAGTAEGVTALQMDIKIEGITKEIMEIALKQANQARLHILGIMNDVITEARTELSVHAPRILTIKIKPEKIGDVIGKGGATIRELTEQTGATIDIAEDGTVKIAAVDGDAGQEACRRIEELTADVEIGTIYEGTVVKIMDFGAFVSILPGKSGLVHISQIVEERVEKVTDFLKEGQEVRVKVLDIDRQGRIRLSMKALSQEESQGEGSSQSEFVNEQ